MIPHGVKYSEYVHFNHAVTFLKKIVSSINSFILGQILLSVLIK